MADDGARRRGGWEPSQRRPRRAFAPLAIVAVVAVAAAVVACGSLSSVDGDYQSATTATPARLEAVAKPAPKRILIFGDSIAAQAGGHAQLALEEVGVDVRVIGLWGQGLFTPEQYDMGATNPHPPAGSVMTAADEAVVEFRPDVIAVSLNHNYWPPYPRDAAGAPIARGSEAFRSMARTQITELVRRLSVTGAEVYLLDPIPERPHEAIAANPIWTAYLSTQDDLGFGVIPAGGVVAGVDGGRVESLHDCTGNDLRVRPADDIHLTYFGAGLLGTSWARQLAEAVGVDASGIEAPSQAPVALTPMGTGYRLVTCDGATFRFGVGGSPFGAAEAPVPAGGAGTPADPVVGAAATPDGDGEWLVTRSGRVVALGSATAAGGVQLADGDKVVGIAAAPNGTGYWVAMASGRVQALGGAEDAGGLEGTGEDVVDIAASPEGGYWLLTNAGRVAGFAGAEPFGGLGRDTPSGGVVALAAHPTGGGYWVLDRSGAVHAFGTSRDLGSAADQPLAKVTRFASTADFDTVHVPATDAPTEGVALLPTPSGDGYWVLLANGAVCSFGDAPHIGGIHRSEVDQVLMLKGQEYYGEGPCRQKAGFGPPNTGG
jgi:hypothetical protein